MTTALNRRQRRWLGLAVALTLYAAIAGADSRGRAETTEIDWSALIDKTWQPQILLDQFIAENEPTQEQIYKEIERLSAASPVEPSLDQKVVKMPGYVLPVEFDGTNVKEFLLVPYRGACIHVPPPPPNQVVYGKASGQEGLQIEGMFAPVWVIGKMHVESVINELAEAAYTMDVYEVIPYEF